MLLTYQKESVYPLLAIQSLASIHHPLLAIHPPLAIQSLLAFMPSNDY